MVAARILLPDSKLATTRRWHDTTLPEALGVADATEDDLYAALDWLLGRQALIERKLVKRHLAPGDFALYDLSSSYVEGSCCPLARLGYSRDGKRGTQQVNYGLLTSPLGVPVAMTLFPGNTTDSTTVLGQVDKLRGYGLSEFVLVGDRGMLSDKQIEELRGKEGIHWITAVRTDGLRELVKTGPVQLGLFDEMNLRAFTHADFPGERLLACFNPLLARKRAYKREDMLRATREELDKVARMVASGKLVGKARIGVRTGKVVNKYLMAKHIVLDIEDGAFSYSLNEESIAKEAALDGVYVIRTNLPEERLSDEDTVRSYKLLTGVERAFRTMKGLEIQIRPIYHHLEDRVRAHFFLCMLAYYVEWHMREAWRSLLFADEDQAAKRERDPVAPARRSAAALQKAHTGQLADDTPAHSFRSLLGHLSTIVRNECRIAASTLATTFTMTTIANPKQAEALRLLERIQPGRIISPVNVESVT
jgi:transposase